MVVDPGFDFFAEVGPLALALSHLSVPKILGFRAGENLR